MTILEALKEITSIPKWYIGKYKHPYASHLKRRIALSKAKPSTIKEFMNKFGYYGDFNEWHKKTVVPGGCVHITMKAKEEI